MQTTEFVHQKIGEDSACGSSGRDLTRIRKYVNCPECILIITGKRKASKVVHEREVKVKIKPEYDAEKKITQTTFNAKSKMIIETSPFYLGLCKGFDYPSLMKNKPSNDKGFFNR